VLADRLSDTQMKQQRPIQVSDGRRTRGENARARLAFTGIALLLLSLLTGGASLSTLPTTWADFVKIVAVALFVGSMVALSLGMIGDARRRR
jgi:uncharacterized membrane protein YgdD (TMEM256/DUF423 family)